MNDTSYAVLFEKIVISSGVYMFKPQYLIEGLCEYDPEYEAEIFTTDVSEYLLMNDPDVGCDDEFLCVGYVINENDLLNDFDDSLEDAKIEYFNLVCDYIYLGFLSFDCDKINVTRMMIPDLYDELMKTDTNAEVTLDAEPIEMTYDSNATEGVQPEIVANICISPENIEELLKMNNLDEIKGTLKDYLDRSNILIESVKQQLGITDDPKKVLLDKIYNSLSSIDDINEVNKIIPEIIKVYDEQIKELDVKEQNGFDVSNGKHYLKDMIKNFESLKTCKDLDEFNDSLDTLYLKYLEVLEKNTKKSEVVKKEEKQITTTEINVKDMKAFFDERIIGQEQAKRDVISAIKMNSLREDPTFKTSCLLIGPTGSGKTMIAQTVSQYLDLPMVIIDSTQLTVPGYVGANLEDFLSDLIGKANGNLELAQRGIVVFDEIDKKGSESNADISGRGVLNTILPFVQGTTYTVTYNNRSYKFDTTNLTCFATGAFTNVANRVSSDGYSSNKIGFNSDYQKEDKKQDIEYKKIKPVDLSKYGGIPEEFTGRFSVIAQLKGHTPETLKQILLNKHGVLNSEKEILAKVGITLDWTEEYLDEVTKKAVELKTGARSLKTTVEESISEARWTVLNDVNLYEKLILTKETVKDPTKYELVLKEQSKVLKKTK